MEWITLIYIAIGFYKTAVRYMSDNPMKKPIWMLTEKNPSLLFIYILLHSIFWPFAYK